MLHQFLLYRIVRQSHMYTYYLSSWSLPSDGIQFLMLYSRTSLLIHSKCNQFASTNPKLHIHLTSYPPTPTPDCLTPGEICKGEAPPGLNSGQTLRGSAAFKLLTVVSCITVHLTLASPVVGQSEALFHVLFHGPGTHLNTNLHLRVFPRQTNPDRWEVIF